MKINKIIKPVVCIPVYKSELNRYEIISLKRHLNILRNYDIYLLTPKSKVSKIINRIDSLEIDHSQYKIHIVQDKYLNSVFSYNQLVLSLDFYLY